MAERYTHFEDGSRIDGTLADEAVREERLRLAVHMLGNAPEGLDEVLKPFARAFERVEPWMRGCPDHVAAAPIEDPDLLRQLKLSLNDLRAAAIESERRPPFVPDQIQYHVNRAADELVEIDRLLQEGGSK